MDPKRSRLRERRQPPHRSGGAGGFPEGEGIGRRICGTGPTGQGEEGEVNSIPGLEVIGYEFE